MPVVPMPEEVAPPKDVAAARRRVEAFLAETQFSLNTNELPVPNVRLGCWVYSVVSNPGLMPVEGTVVAVSDERVWTTWSGPMSDIWIGAILNDDLEEEDEDD